MNKLQHPNDSEDASTQANQPARRRPRRATRPVMTPDSPPESAEPSAPQEAASNTSELDVFAELGDQEGGRKKPGSAQAAGDLSLDDLVLPEREGASPKPPAKTASAEESQQEGDQDSPRLPATALLFQAPEITPRTRKGRP